MNEKKFATSLTDGIIWKQILSFAFPLFMGQLFQQLYNVVDTLIVGNFLGKEPLAAISTTGPVIFLMVGLFNGMAIGSGVVVARYYGEENVPMLRKAIHTILIFAFLCGVFLTIFGVNFIDDILRIMKTPDEVLPLSVAYFQMYFMGSVAFVVYNYSVGILQSVGDSKHPLYYLILSSVLNVVLDLFFIAILHKGIESAAFATIISQFVSAICCLVRLFIKSPDEYRMSFSELRMDLPILKQILRNGIPTGLQNSVISIANVFVQSNINSFGAVAMAGCGCYQRIEGFTFLPTMSFSMALTTFVSQNLGAKRYDRVKEGGRFGLIMGVGLAELIGFLIFLFMPYFALIFTRDAAVIAFSARTAHVTGLFFFGCATSHCVSGILRGSGKSAVPMYIMLCVWCLFRVFYISNMLRIFPRIEVVFSAYPVTWMISMSIFLFYYFKTDWVHGYPNNKHAAIN